MKNYLELSNYDLEKATELLNEDATNLLNNKEVVSTMYGNGFITKAEMTVIRDIPTVRATVQFNGVEKLIVIRVAKENGVLSYSDDVQKLVEEVESVCSDIYNYELQKKHEAEIAQDELIKSIKEKEKEEIRQKKLEIKRENLKQSNLNLAQKLDKFKLNGSTSNFYTGLGYIAKNASNITADMPDYLDSWFTGVFGNVPHRAVDQTRLSPSGLPSQYALALKVNLKTNENIPDCLVKYLGDVSKKVKPISNTEFVFSLVRDYGFKFGKTQDLDKIMENIPDAQLDNFRLGLNLI